MVEKKNESRPPFFSNPAGIITATASGLAILTTVLLLLQPYDPRNVKVLGKWPYSYFGLSISFAILGLVIILLHRFSKKPWALNLALITLGSYLFLVPFELICHTNLIGVVGKGSYGLLWHIPNPAVRKSIAANSGYTTSRDFYQYQTLPGILPKPNIKFRTRIFADRGVVKYIDLKLDKDGFNNSPGIAELKQVDTVCVGDSFTFGVVEREFNYCSQAMKALGQPILNLGMGGFGPQQTRTIIENKALGRAPKRVIWQFYWNDLSDAANLEQWLKNHNEKSWFQFLGDIGKATWWYEGDSDEKPAWLYFPDIALGLLNVIRHQVIWKKKSEESAALEIPVLDKGNLAVLPSVYPGKGYGPVRSLAEWTENGSIDRKGGRIEFSMARKKVLALIEAEIVKAVKECDRIGAQLILMPVPSHLFVYADTILEYGAKNGLYQPDTSDPQNDLLWDAPLFLWLEKVAGTQGAIYWDFPNYLKRKAKSPEEELFFYALDKHLNKAGNRVLGEYLAHMIRSGK